MKTNYKIAISIFTLALSTACNDINNFIPDPVNTLQILPSGIMDNFKDLNTKTFEFDFDPKLGGVYVFPDGSLIEFGPNSFTDFGNTVTCNLVKAKFRIVQNRKEMVGNTIGTNAGNSPLISGGMVNTQVFCDQTELQLAPGKKYSLKLVLDPKLFNDEFEMFYGEVSEYRFSWVEADNNANTQNNVKLSEWRIKGFQDIFVGIECFPERLKWVNCDYFAKFENIEKTEPCLIAKTPASGDVIQLISFCVFKEFNAVITPCCSDEKSGKICFTQLPINAKVEYVIIGKGKTNYYYGFSSKLVEKNEVTTINLELVSLEELKKLISNL